MQCQGPHFSPTRCYTFISFFTTQVLSRNLLSVSIPEVKGMRWPGWQKPLQIWNHLGAL